MGEKRKISGYAQLGSEVQEKEPSEADTDNTDRFEGCRAAVM